MSFEQGFEPNNDTSQDAVGAAEHRIEVFSILKFVLAVVVAVSIVVYVLIWMKQYTGMTPTPVAEEAEVVANDEEVIEISPEERQAILDELSAGEVVDDDGVATDVSVEVDERQAILDAINESESGEENSVSPEERQAILDSM